MKEYALYGGLRSGSAAVEMALAEADASVATHDLSLERGEQHDPVFLRLNPAGRLPVLVLPDGTVLTESLAILLTVCDRHPGADLLPQGPGRGKVLRWMAFLAGEIYPAVSRDDYPERFSTDPAAAPGIRDAAQEFMRRAWQRVEAEAVQAPFLLGNRFSVADLYLAVMSRWALPYPWFGVSCPRVDALAAAVAARPRCAPVWRRHFPSG